jgi:hypothetical protein
LQFGRQFADEFFNSLRLVPVTDQDRISGADNDQVMHAEQCNARFTVVENDVITCVERR